MYEMYISLIPQTQIVINCKSNYRGLLNTVKFQLKSHPPIISNSDYRPKRYANITIEPVEFPLVKKL